jgi:hypothetical protein
VLKDQVFTQKRELQIVKSPEIIKKVIKDKVDKKNPLK